MCLVVIGFDVDADHKLIVAANRDEFHRRPTRVAEWWADHPDVLGGRDLTAGGSWLALHRNGRFATVTNDRDAEPKHSKLRSRGHLVTDFLLSESAPISYLSSLDTDRYAGFNLLVSDGRTLAYLSNRDGSPRELQPGTYSLSNATLDTVWEKTERSRSRLLQLLRDNRANETELLRLLADRDKGPTDEIANSHLPFRVAHATTAPFIVLPDFGTRCSTVVRASRSGHWSLLERRFDPTGKANGESRGSFDVIEQPQ